jgi:hypothetical protein
MERLLRLLGGNLALTIASVIVCVNVFYAVSLIVNAGANPGAPGFLKDAVDAPLAERYLWVRNFFLILGSAIGLIAAQVVWVLDHLDKSRPAH